ncbi:MAG: hypothetical protein AB7S26_13425 [Sandaracinaceae bacterium]
MPRRPGSALAAAILATVGALACGGAASGPVAPEASAERIELALRIPSEGARLACTRTVELLMDGSAAPWASEVDLRFRPIDHDVLRLRTYGTPYRVAAEGERAERVAGARFTVRTRVDAHARAIEEPAVGGGAERSMYGTVVVAIERLLEPVFPEAPVAVGTTWREEPSIWRPRAPPATVAIERTFTLHALEGEGSERVAWIRTDATARVSDLSMGGTALSGEARVRGMSAVRASDGLPRSASYEVSLSVSGEGIGALFAGQSIGAKIRDRCAPAAPRGRPLVSGVPPVSAR